MTKSSWRFASAVWRICLPEDLMIPSAEHRPDAELHVGDAFDKRCLSAPSMFVPGAAHQFPEFLLEGSIVAEEAG
jgi:hypothetical protein